MQARPENFEVSLAVPAGAQFHSLIAAVLDDCTARAECTHDARERIRAAGISAFGLIVDRAMAQVHEAVRVHITARPDSLRVQIAQRGIPMDAQHAAQDERWKVLLSYADRATWRWRGRAGTELTLIFTHSASSSPSAATPARVVELAQAPQQEYVVRRFEPADAHGVVRCFYANYGYAYDVPAVYQPRRLQEMNAQQQYISFVALDAGGEVVGHYALDHEPGAVIAEGCGAVVDPRHRGRHLLERLRSEAESHARRIGLAAYYTQPVTDHAITQNESEKLGAHITAISLGFSPRTMLAKQMDGLTATAQRQSLTLYVKLLQQPPQRVMYAPPAYRNILLEIYEQLGIEVDSRCDGSASADGCLHVNLANASGNATITVERAGSDVAPALAQAVADLTMLGGLGAVYVVLPLTDPGTPALAHALRHDGFFFSGLAPWMCAGTDGLVMQRLLAPIDLDALTIASDFAQRLVAFIRQDEETIVEAQASHRER